jgi:hypothetical protein
LTFEHDEQSCNDLQLGRPAVTDARAGAAEARWAPETAGGPILGADARPNWAERPAVPSLTETQ